MQDDALAGDAAATDRPDTAGVAAAQTDEGVPGAPSEEDDEQEEETPGRSGWSFLQEMVVLFAVALTIALLIKSFVVQPFFIPSGSMEDTLLIGDKVLVNKLVYHLRPIQRGDIVVFNGEGSWLPPAQATQPNHNPVARLWDDTLGKLITSVEGLFGTPVGQTDYIKRVIGLPGDHVACCNAKGQITVNGIALHEQAYLISGAQPSQYHFSVVVPPGRLWVMGDNRPYSADSRLHKCGYPDPETQCEPYDRNGTIPEDKVIGRAFLIVWPPSRFRVLPIPATFDQAGLSHAARSSSPAGLPASRGVRSVAGGIPVRQSPSYVPLAAGFVAAAPLTLLERRLRLRRRHRRAQGRRRRLSGRACHRVAALTSRASPAKVGLTSAARTVGCPPAVASGNCVNRRKAVPGSRLAGFASGLRSRRLTGLLAARLDGDDERRATHR
jgi:signal peptidase I